MPHFLEAQISNNIVRNLLCIKLGYLEVVHNEVDFRIWTPKPSYFRTAYSAPISEPNRISLTRWYGLIISRHGNEQGCRLTI